MQISLFDIKPPCRVPKCCCVFGDLQTMNIKTRLARCLQEHSCAASDVYESATGNIPLNTTNPIPPEESGCFACLHVQVVTQAVILVGVIASNLIKGQFRHSTPQPAFWTTQDIKDTVIHASVPVRCNKRASYVPTFTDQAQRRICLCDC